MMSAQVGYKDIVISFKQTQHSWLYGFIRLIMFRLSVMGLNYGQHLLSSFGAKYFGGLIIHDYENILVPDCRSSTR